MIDMALVPMLEFRTHCVTASEVTGIVRRPDDALHWFDFKAAS